MNYLSLIFIFFNSLQATLIDIPHIPSAMKACKENYNISACYRLALLEDFNSNKKQKNEFLLLGCEYELERVCTLKEANQKAIKFLAIERAKKIQQEDQLKKKNKYSKLDLEREKACERGDGNACHKVGTYFYYIATPIDQKRGIKNFKRGCELKHKNSCSSLGLINKGMVKMFDIKMYPDQESQK